MFMRPTRHRLVLPLAVALAAGSAAPALGQIQWRSPLAPAFSPQKDAAALLAKVAADPGSRHVVVQLARPVTDADRASLAAAGLRLCAPLGGTAFFAAVDPASFSARSVVIAQLVSGAQIIDPMWKIHPALTAGDSTAWTSVGTSPTKDGKGEPVVAMYAVLHADVLNDAAAAGIVAKHGGIVRSTVGTINAMVIELPISSARVLAAEDSVQWLEPALPLLTPTNIENRALTRIDQVQAAPYSLTGAGVTALIYDGGGVRTTHQDLAGRVTVIDGSSTNNHATHVSGTVAGTGSASGGTQRGMAPGALILSASLSTGSSGWLYTNPSDIEADYTIAYSLGADVANNSIGTNVNANGFSCTWHGDYGVTDGVIDGIVRGSPTVTGGGAFRIVWAAGNERGGRCDTGGFRTIGPPAGAKNHLSIGAVNANNDSMTSFSGWGPTDDGRLKPDFCAPGCQTGGDGGVTSTGSNNDAAYTVLCGTSMASPTATGVVALMLEDWSAQYPESPLPRNSMLKALVAQSAFDLGNVGPDYTYGYGSIRADAAIDLLRSGALAEDSLSQGFVHVYSVTIAPGSGPLVVTTAWDDVPGTANIIPSLINDLDLRVFAPGGERHYPWTLDPANPSAAAVRTAEDHLNNIEQVRVDAPAAGVWTIEVRATSVPQGPQAYSIVASDASLEFSGSVSIAIEPISLAPAALQPNTASPMSILVDIDGDTLVPGSVQLHYRGSGGAFTSIALSDSGEGIYNTTLPGFGCDDSPEYYFTAEGTLLGAVSLPATGSASPFTALVGDLSTTFFDMETAAGWTGGAPGDDAVSGQWERGDPENTAAQPGEDHTPEPGVNCWVTGRQAGSGVGTFDVDGGSTTLLSPIFSLENTAPSTRIGYWRWYSNTAGASPNADVFTVDISNNGGTSWTTVEIVGPAGEETSGGWFYHEFAPSSLLPLTATMRMRFIASDLGAGSIVEAAVDDVSIYAVACSDACAADFDQNGTVEVPDIFSFLSAWFAQEPAADFDGVGGIAVPDIFAFLSSWFAGC